MLCGHSVAKQAVHYGPKNIVSENAPSDEQSSQLLVSELLLFIKKNSESLVQTLSNNETEKEKWPWLQAVSEQLNAVNETEQNLAEGSVSAGDVLGELVQLSSLLGSLAVINEDQIVLQGLLQLKAFDKPELKAHLQSTMDLAIREDHKQMIEILKQYKVQPSDSLLLQAVAKGEAQKVSLLLSYGASKDAFYMLGPDDNPKGEPGIQRIEGLLTSIYKLDEGFDSYLKEDPFIKAYFYQYGFKSLYTAWSPVIVAAANNDLETLKVLKKAGVQPFKHELAIIGKVADQMIGITEVRKVKSFRSWWNIPTYVAATALGIATIPFVPVPDQYKKPLIKLVGASIFIWHVLGNAGSVLVEQLWARRSVSKKLNFLTEGERAIYLQLKAFDLEIHQSIESVLD